MRELKFRVWNAYEKEMQYCKDLYWFEENDVRDSQRDGINIMQYTGLKDKTGKEIYDGDILKQSYYDMTDEWDEDWKYSSLTYYLVEWCGEMCAYCFKMFKITDGNGNFKELLSPVKPQYMNISNENVWDMEFRIEENEIGLGYKIETEIIGNIYEHPELMEVEP